MSELAFLKRLRAACDAHAPSLTGGGAALTLRGALMLFTLAETKTPEEPRFLGPRLGIPAPSVTRTAQTLAGAKLLERRKHPSGDGRLCLWAITPVGEALVAAACATGAAEAA